MANRKARNNSGITINCHSNFVTLKTQKKIHLLQQSQCSFRKTRTYSEIQVIGACEHSPLYAKFMNILPNKKKRKEDMLYLSY